MKKSKLRRNWKIRWQDETQEIAVPYDFPAGLSRRADAKTGADEGYFENGRAVYSTSFTADAAPHHFLSFDGVMGLTEVYVNGNLVKFHPYGYTAFLCDIQPFIGRENELVVVADTSQKPASRWYAGGGIYRDVTLLTADAEYIVPDSVVVDTNYLSESSAYVTVAWKIHAEKTSGAETQIEIPELGISMKRYVWLETGENSFSVRTMLSGITAWSPETPVLYTCTVSVQTENSADSDTISFGVRTVACDPRNGLLLNGVPVKLYGTCVHHDNGIIGAASYSAAEERRVRILKENGFNAIRTAHNPPSAAMLDACDRLGMLVIDEIFDAWRLPKRDFDYHVWFDAHWAEDTDSMVCRDRRHPSVIMWSTGNEIFEKTGVSDGYRTSREIADRIRMHDNTRPVTHAFCSFWDNPDLAKREQETASVPAEEMDFFADRIKYTAGTLDVYGYNYLLWRLDKDEVRFPDMLFALTESFPLDAVEVKKYMDAHPRMIGEFVWTGWDYFGETGIGHVKYGVSETASWGLTPYPNHIADCGDFDICGNRKPQSYYREAAWCPGSVRILTADPAHSGETYAMSAWGFYDVNRSWTYPGMEGMTTTVHLYTTADSCELWCNGESCGIRKPSEKGIDVFEIPYRPGRLTAAAYDSDGTILGRDELVTTEEPVSLHVRAADVSDLIYAEIELLDKNGRTAWQGCNEIAVQAVNGMVIGTGSGKNATEHVYTSPRCCAEHGRLLAAVLPDEGAETVTITVTAGDMTAQITV